MLDFALVAGDSTAKVLHSTQQRGEGALLPL